MSPELLNLRVAVVGVLCGLCSAAGAASPKITHLFPAGMQRGADATVSCHGEFDWPLRVWAPGADVRVSDSKGKLKVYVPKDFVGNRIWLRFYNEEGPSDVLPFLVGSLAETNEVEPNDSTSAAQVIAKQFSPPNDSNVTVNGVLQKRGDVDSFALRLRKGQTLVAAVAANAFGSPIDAILQVVSAKGIVLAENHDAIGLDPRLAFVAQEAGTYVVRIFAFPSEPNQRIYFHGDESAAYRLTMTTGPYLSHSIPMSVSAPNTVVELRGWNIPPGARFPVVPLEYDDIDRLELEPSGKLRLHHFSPGMVQVPGWAGSSRVRFGSPKLSIHYEESHNDRKVRTLTVPSLVSGCIRRPEQLDQFRLSLKKGEQVALSVDALGLDSALVPKVQLRDPEGKLVAESRESGAASDVDISHKVTSEGDFVLSIRDRFGHGGDRYYYELTIDHPKPDFALSVDTDVVKLTLGQPVTLPVNVTRRSGQGKDVGAIEIEAIDLPDGVFATTAVSKPSTENADKVTLQFETEGIPVCGPIRIRGVETVSKRSRWALTPAKYRTSLTSMWLTVVDAQPSDE